LPPPAAFWFGPPGLAINNIELLRTPGLIILYTYFDSLSCCRRASFAAALVPAPAPASPLTPAPAPASALALAREENSNNNNDFGEGFGEDFGEEGSKKEKKKNVL
jgi:hypothetical protein